jgi:hypothetical protein
MQFSGVIYDGFYATTTFTDSIVSVSIKDYNGTVMGCAGFANYVSFYNKIVISNVSFNVFN